MDVLPPRSSLLIPSPRFRVPAPSVGFGVGRSRGAPRPGEDAPAGELWRALRECEDLSCRFSTRVGFLVAEGALAPAHACRPFAPAVLEARTPAWAAARVSAHIGRPALHVVSREGFDFLRVAPGASLPAARWESCLRKATRLPRASSPAPGNPFAAARPAGSPGAAALPRFWEDVRDARIGCVVTLRSAGMRSRFPLRPSHVACDSGRLLVAVDGGPVLHLDLADVAGVRRDADDVLALLDVSGEEAMRMGPLLGGPRVCGRTWAALVDDSFPRE